MGINLKRIFLINNYRLHYIHIIVRVCLIITHSNNLKRKEANKGERRDGRYTIPILILPQTSLDFLSSHTHTPTHSLSNILCVGCR